ncbi:MULTISPECIES: ABC transporter ATP-binding protein [unclassified Pseudonocardia]|uniref:ABC transporter ATP-binding protein n=1 Tax=unclassified Pseudonocardia TaxID=2619320 RepID=UPI0007614E9B|nr:MULTISPECIES: ABC transporter ATP-binding protein [unclassified Pseudonocardia]
MTALTEEATAPPVAPPDPRARARAESAALTALLRPVAVRIRVAQVLAAVGAAAGLVPFVALAQLADTLLAPGPVDPGAVTGTVWLVVAGLGARGGITGLALAITHFADVRLQAVLRRRMAAHLGRVPLGWFSERSSGLVRKAAQDDVHELHQVVAHHPVEWVAAWMLPLAGLGYLTWLDWRLALLAVATVPFYAAAYAYMMSGYTEKVDEMHAGHARISAAVVEFVSGIAVVKTFGQARRAHRGYAEAARDFGRFYAAWVRPMLRIEAVSTMAISAPVVLLVSCAGVVWFTGTGWVTPVEGMTGILIALVVPTTITALGFGAQNRRTAAAAALRIHELLDTPVLPVPDVPRVPEGHRVELSGVRFAYPGGAEVLRGIDLDCPEGTVTALVGPSGAGKSTLATLVARFHDVTGGTVRIGGTDVREIDPEVLYRHVGFVLQDVQLLHGTVAGNVRLGRPGASDEDLHAACRAARIDDRVRALPRGYDSVVGEDALLSGGEAQRVSIARALLADTPVLVLDEATAFADPESEAEIQDALSELARGRTVIVVAHRLSTITGADRIAVVDTGRIVESGTHDELVARGGRYAAMWTAHRAGEDVR